MPRASYVYRDGKFVPKHEAIMADRQLNAKNVSDLPFPYIMGDIPEYRSTITGEMIDGRKQHRDHLKAHGCIEMGNEKPKAAGPVTIDKADVARDIKDAVEQLEAGYKPPPSIIGTKDEEGNVIEAPETDEALTVPDASTIDEKGSYVRGGV